jgi:GNAT superfamily N-acetyltransferase
MRPMPEFAITAADPQGADALALLREAALEARALYPELIGADASMPTNPPLQDRAAYLVAYQAGVPVGCGALRPIDTDTAEVRRMYVLRSHRRYGIARALLVELEQAAAALHYAVLRLETGYRQTAAMALYESFGFHRIPAFGEHASDPTSVCFEKTVMPGGAP